MVKDLESVIIARGLKKKFCRDIRTSMRYSFFDLLQELCGLRPDQRELREKEFWAVGGIDFTLRRGDIVAFLGPNGAGKTTTMRLLNGILKPDAGEIKVSSKRASLHGAQGFFNSLLTGKENALILGAAMGYSRKYMKSCLPEIEKISGLGDAMNAALYSYSSGMFSRLALGTIAQLKPDIVFFDSVYGPADAEFRKEYPKVIRELAKQAGVIVAVHSLELIRRACTSIVVIAEGKKIYHSDDVEGGIQYYLNLHPAKKSDK